jgi:hypothetical protein
VQKKGSQNLLSSVVQLYPQQSNSESLSPVTASSAALPITIRMRSAVINIFTDAMTAAISLAFIAFAALALSAMFTLRGLFNSIQAQRTKHTSY